MGFSPCPSVLSSRKVQVLTPSWWTPTYRRSSFPSIFQFSESGLTEDDDRMFEFEVA